MISIFTRLNSRTFFVVQSLLLFLLSTSVALADFDPQSDFRLAKDASVDRHGQTLLALACAGFIGARTMDNQARDYFAHRRRIGELEDADNDVLGSGAPGILIGGFSWWAGRRKHNSRIEHSGQAQIEALLTTSIATSLLKGSVRRTRPDGSDQYSFPSGHTSSAFATAGVLDEFFGHAYGIPAYLLATSVGVARISSDRHWFSDTVAGAALGLFFSHAFARAHGADANDTSQNVALFPVISSTGTELTARIEF